MAIWTFDTQVTGSDWIFELPQPGLFGTAASTAAASGALAQGISGAAIAHAAGSAVLATAIRLQGTAAGQAAAAGLMQGGVGPNRPPVVQNPPNLVAKEGIPKVFQLGPLGTDPDGDAMIAFLNLADAPFGPRWTWDSVALTQTYDGGPNPTPLVDDITLGHIITFDDQRSGNVPPIVNPHWIFDVPATGPDWIFEQAYIDPAFSGFAGAIADATALLLSIDPSFTGDAHAQATALANLISTAVEMAGGAIATAAATGVLSAPTFDVRRHLRTRIRQKIASLLLGNTDAGARVFTQRVYPFADDELPAILVETLDDQEDATVITLDPIEQRELPVVIQCSIKQELGLEDALDNFMLQVERIVKDPVNKTLEGLASGGLHDWSLKATLEPGDEPIGVAELRCMATYFIQSNDPGVPL